jgi:hypothetical protein
MHRVLRLVVRGVEIHVDGVGHERRERSDEPGGCLEAFPQRQERGPPTLRARFPKTATRPSHIPVGKVVDEAIQPPAGMCGVECVECVRDLPDRVVELGQDPAIEHVALGNRESLGVGVEVFQ